MAASVRMQTEHLSGRKLLKFGQLFFCAAPNNTGLPQELVMAAIRLAPRFRTPPLATPIDVEQFGVFAYAG